MAADQSEQNIAWYSKFDSERAQMKTAIGYLPNELVNAWPKKKVALITMFDRLGLRVAEDLRENRELVFLSERVFPRNGVPQDDRIYKHFIFVVLHEIAHIYLDHPQTIPEDERDKYEGEAHNQAKEWYDQHAANLQLSELNLEEMKEINNQLDIEFNLAVRMVRKKMSPVKIPCEA